MRYWREFAGLSHRDVADACGVSVQATRLWESELRGKNRGNPPTLGNLHLFVKACRITMAEFWGPIPGQSRRAS